MNVFMVIGIGIILIVLVVIFFLGPRKKKVQKSIGGTNKKKVSPKLITPQYEKSLTDYVDEIYFIVTKDYIILEDEKRVYLKDVLYFTKLHSTVEVHLLNETSTTPMNFLEISKRIPPNFIQCNDKQIVNMDWVASVEHTSINLENHETMQVHPNYYQFLKN